MAKKPPAAAVRFSRAARATPLRLLRGTIIATAAAGSIPALAGPMPSATPVLAPKPLEVIQSLGNKDFAESREGRLLSRQGSNQQPEAYDPFRVEMRGKFRGLPPVKITLAPAKPNPMPAAPAKPNAPAAATTPATGAVDGPTWEKAVEHLSIGAVNVWSREVLIGSQLVREGDLMVVQFEGKVFPIWVRHVSEGEVAFCNTELQEKLKPVHTGPKELPDRREDELKATTLFLRAQ